jgi:hypothetical protein
VSCGNRIPVTKWATARYSLVQADEVVDNCHLTWRGNTFTLGLDTTPRYRLSWTAVVAV